MKRIFKVSIRKGGNAAPTNNSESHYEVIAANATDAIEKATKQFKKEQGFAAPVLVEQVLHRGPAL